MLHEMNLSFDRKIDPTTAFFYGGVLHLYLPLITNLNWGYKIVFHSHVTLEVVPIFRAPCLSYDPLPPNDLRLDCIKL